jgi:hypothetical protein
VEKTTEDIMKKHVGLFIIVLMLPLMSQQPAHAITAILVDDFYCGPAGRVFNTESLYIGNDPVGAHTTPYMTYLVFKLPEMKDGGSLDFHLGVYLLKGASTTSSSYAGVYAVADNALALAGPQPTDASTVVNSLYPYPFAAEPLAVQGLNPANPGWVYFDFTIAPDSPYYKGLFDGVMVLAMAVPSDHKTGGLFVFSSMDGPYAPEMDCTGPSPVPEPAAMILLSVGLVVLACLRKKTAVTTK